MVYENRQMIRMQHLEIKINKLRYSKMMMALSLCFRTI